MANRTLFPGAGAGTGGGRGRPAAPTDTRNEAGGVAYALSDRAALAQYAITGTLANTFYATAETQLETVRELCAKVDPEFIAKAALYCRERGYMKDMPALLLSILLTDKRESQAVDQAMDGLFNRIVDNGRMLRNVVQMLRSGALGRKSLGSRPKRLIETRLNSWDAIRVWRNSIGSDPSMADVLKLAHPQPISFSHDAVFGYLIGKNKHADALPEAIREFEAIKRHESTRYDLIPFEFLTALELDTNAWKEIARRMTWTQLRMNINTLKRHGVFEDKEMVRYVAERLRDAEAVRKSRVFPYQLLMAYTTVSEAIDTPHEIKEALQDALDAALVNIPDLPGKVYVFPDVSGSMSSAVTGDQGRGRTSKVRCIDVAALVAAAILRKNPDAGVLPFETTVRNITLNPRDSVMTNARKLAAIGGGGTNCSAPLQLLNERGMHVDAAIYVSDNESWIDSPRNSSWGNRGSATMQAWEELRKRNPNAKLITIDLQPYGTAQVQGKGRDDILQIGGFGDNVFDVISQFISGNAGAEHWVNEIERVDLRMRDAVSA